MADTGDLKSPALTGVRVRPPPSAQALQGYLLQGFSCTMEKGPIFGPWGSLCGLDFPNIYFRLTVVFGMLLFFSLSYPGDNNHRAESPFADQFRIHFHDQLAL